MTDADPPPVPGPHPSPLTPLSSDVTGRTFVFDIDGVIAGVVPDMDYAAAGPMEANIRIVNRLYDQGNRIVLFTARGTMTGIDWSAVTADQMARWGVRHHELRFGKPAGDYYVDDRMVSLDDLSRLFG